MLLTFLQTGKTEEPYLNEGIALFEARIRHWIPYKSEVLPALKNTRNMPVELQKQKEWEQMARFAEKSDYLVLLDERGTEYTSREFAGFLQDRMNAGVRNLMFACGGPYGFSPSAYRAARHMVAFSKMTFSHQMIRLFFVEQVYRALSILNGTPYHNE